MAHWGWYWKIKLKYKRKRLCSNLSTIDSFELFKNKIGVELCRGRVAFEYPAYQLEATLLDDHYHVEYDGGSYNIPIEKKACNYGGFRYFFHCPKCNRRMRILYCDKGKFLCRKCLNLCYFTQILRPTARCLIMGGKIRDKLHSMAGSIDKKPPWMKKKTFERLQNKYFDYYEIKYEEALHKELLEYYPHKKDLVDDFF